MRSCRSGTERPSRNDSGGARRLPIERIAFDDELAYGAGLLLPAMKPFGFSFGDRACLALARYYVYKFIE